MPVALGKKASEGNGAWYSPYSQTYNDGTNGDIATNRLSSMNHLVHVIVVNGRVLITTAAICRGPAWGIKTKILCGPLFHTHTGFMMPFRGDKEQDQYQDAIAADSCRALSAYAVYFGFPMGFGWRAIFLDVEFQFEYQKHRSEVPDSGTAGSDI